MTKSTFVVLLLLQIVCASYAAVPNGGGLAAACKKSSNVNFCGTLLQPFAAQFSDNVPLKMGHAVAAATLAKSQAAKTFIAGQANNAKLNANQKAAVKVCLDKVEKSLDSLKHAAREFDKMQGSKGPKRVEYRNKVIGRLTLSSNEQMACFNSMKAAGAGDIVQKVMQHVDEGAKAGFVAQSFIQAMN
ncbi:hypothetical protein BUALT_Bualt01G0065200 [Buddleja alternifolia]|uniref:Pectinesterase inhibitor domain-containing protein n=1 Tax=Buddleja alternifolia TaxID=168488 RepID=A0AAV6Y924_9LAMI|nr:hypothetical protein BUALT_BualtUnG0027900 [Buddleja alternifolia]KAG8390260.1 hypothetical protein BUALT_Bualt01G0065200 [Buddleja alternifolia]